MSFKKYAASMVLLSSLVGGGGALAQAPANAEFFPFAEIMSMKMMDKNKDSMVSKKEFMDMMTMAWDMNAKKMGVKGDKMTPDQFKEILMYLKAGG